MIPIVSEFRWLRHNPRRFFTVDGDAFTLFEVDRNYKFEVVENYSERSSLSGTDSDSEDEPSGTVPFRKVHQMDFLKNVRLDFFVNRKISDKLIGCSSFRCLKLFTGQRGGTQF